MQNLPIAEKPGDPYVKCVANPLIGGGHEVLLWPLHSGVAAFVNIGPPGLARTIQSAPDGIHIETSRGQLPFLERSDWAWPHLSPTPTPTVHLEHP